MIYVDLIKIVNFHGCLLISAIIFVVPFLLLLVHRKLRPKFAINVQCWFCGTRTSVPYGNRNCWDCVSCDQYNGFKDDGDYNKPIPAQYDEDLNFPTMSGIRGKSGKSFSNGLCTHCNSNQEVKMKLLSSFVPINVEKEDEEYRNYIHHLDKLYFLCWHCDIHTQKYLSRQDAILRNSLPPNYNPVETNIDVKPVKPFTLPKATYIFLFTSLFSLIPLLIQSFNEMQQGKRIILPISELILNYLPQSQISLFVGFISTTIVIGLIGKDRWHINDALLTSFWVSLQVLYSNELIDEKLYLNHLINARPLMIAFIIIFSIITYYVKVKQITKSQRINSFKLKKNEYSLPTNKTTSIATNSCLDDSFSTDDECSEDPLYPLDASLNAVHITPPNQKKIPYQGDIGYEFEISHLMKPNASYPIVRPARFNPRSITHSSWVAGGFWSLPMTYNNKIYTQDRTALNYAMAGYQSSGLFTPPPSVTSSLESRTTSAAGSYYNRDWQSSSAASVRSWPPSFYSAKLASNCYTPSCRSRLQCSRPPSQASEACSTTSVATMTVVPKTKPLSKKSFKFLITLCIGCSVLGNLLFLSHYLSWSWPIRWPLL